MWNDLDVNRLANGQVSDDSFGGVDPGSDEWIERSRWFRSPHANNGQLWVAEGRADWSLNAYSYPLCGRRWSSNSACTGPSLPLRTIPLTAQPGFEGFPVRGYPGLRMAALGGEEIYFALTQAGDAIWIDDSYASRVFRLTNLNGPGEPEIDVVLGQPDTVQTACNRDGGDIPGPDTLCVPNGVALDANDNLYISDNGREGGSNMRILRFDAALFPRPPALSLLYRRLRSTARVGVSTHGATRLRPIRSSALFGQSSIRADECSWPITPMPRSGVLWSSPTRWATPSRKWPSAISPRSPALAPPQIVAGTCT
jgi:hypothetical protein